MVRRFFPPLVLRWCLLVLARWCLPQLMLRWWLLVLARRVLLQLVYSHPRLVWHPQYYGASHVQTNRGWGGSGQEG